MPSTDRESKRDRFYRKHPDFPWLDAKHPKSIEQFLLERDFLVPGQGILGCTAAGPGNMNLTLRIQTSTGSFILKQSRPWVEKYDHISAPWDRDVAERRFYEYATTHHGLRPRIPKLLGSDSASHVLLLEDVPGATDLSSLYRDTAKDLHDSEIDQLASFLAQLHADRSAAADPQFTNQAMRELNFEHLFEVPFQEETGIQLDELERGLGQAAQAFRLDERLRRVFHETGIQYMKKGPSLLHGDFFPGSWLRSPRGIRIIDFEFSFPGHPAIDVGCAVAHLALAGAGLPSVRRFISSYQNEATPLHWNASLVGRFAGIEVARRLIGVAQLPLPFPSPGSPSKKHRQNLLHRSREAILKGQFDKLFAPP